MNAPAKYQFMSMNDLDNLPLEIDWTVEDFIPSNAVGMIYGASGTGKSHIAFSMAVSIANGIQWFEKDTKQGTVLILAGEGTSGIRRRLKAIEKEHSLTIDPSKLFVSDRGIGLDTTNGYETVLKAINDLDSKPSAIFIDTLARHIEQSDENSNKDMTKFINDLEKIRLEYECSIILVHHTGKDGSLGARGASALKANIDFSFKVTGEKKLCSLKCEKMKDADDNIDIKNFLIKGVDLGQADKKGKAITGGCIVQSGQGPSSQESKRSNADVALDCFNPDKKAWQDAYVKKCTDNINEDSKKRQYREARTSLIDAGMVEENSDGSFAIVEGA
jgi:archaellum biogenesis ATPase FlaH